MKFPVPHTLEQIASIIQSEYIGEANFPVLGMNEIHVVEAGDIVFVDHPKYYEKALSSKATTILINKKVDCPSGKALLISDDPFRDFNKLTSFFKPFQMANQHISDTAKIGKNTVIQPNSFIGNNVIIGDNCVIGSDAFYYKNRPEGFDKLISGGRVVIEDNVDIGALCTLDKGVTGDTRIKKGTKIDNQVHIGHDTVIGEKCLIASQTGIAGCVIIEDEVTLWGQVGVTSAITIGKKAVVLAQTGISKSIEGGKTYFGSPVEEAREKLKQLAYVKRIPEILKKIDSK